MERAFENLLDNAIRHGRGQPALAKARADAMVIRVVDQGPGIPEHEWARIFEPFQRAENGGQDSGSGLGLAIVKGFVEAKGGEVRVESMPGQGTSFVVTLPLERATAGDSGR